MSQSDPPGPEGAAKFDGTSPLEILSKQAFELWLTPKIEKRIAEGRWQRGQWMRIAQVLFSDDATVVRLNDDVKFSAKVDPSTPLIPGAALIVEDFKRIRMTQIDLLDEDADCGHFTVVNMGLPQILFDFRRNKLSAKQLLDLAEQFLNAAKFSMKEGHIGPFLDNLFSSYELVAKSILITSMLTNTEKTHGVIYSAINKARKTGMINSDFVDIFNKIRELRIGARYNPKKLVMLPNNQLAVDVLARDLALAKLQLGSA